MDNDGANRKMWMFPVPFCVMRYINNKRYLPGSSTLGDERLNEQRESNVLCFRSKSPSAPKESCSLRTRNAQVLRNIALGKALLVHYGIEY